MDDLGCLDLNSLPIRERENDVIYFQYKLDMDIGQASLNVVTLVNDSSPCGLLVLSLFL